MTFEAPGSIFTDGGVVSLVDEVVKGDVKLYINVDDMQGAMDVSFPPLTYKGWEDGRIGGIRLMK